MIDLKDMTIEEMGRWFESIGEKKFRAKQVFQWIYRGAEDFASMTDLSKDLRKKLSQNAILGGVGMLQVQKSKTDGTRKYLFGLDSSNKASRTSGDLQSTGLAIETVFMKYKYGNSVCISSQAGCRMGCKFCASTIGGLRRDLTAGEMADQILAVQRDLRREVVCTEASGEERVRIGHVVVMGTGEPFDNYENLKRFINIINSKEGLNIGLRNITVSTCGLIPRIKQFAEELPQVNLAISLHAPNSELRSRMMPINNKYPMEELLAATKSYADKTGRRVTYEYALVHGVNDSPEQADELADKLRHSLCHVNLIPLNSVSETGFEGSDRSRSQRFMQRLESKGIPVTLRRELGSDIDAACGQLRLSAGKRK